MWNHQIDPHWGTTLSAGYNWLNDDVANSPIVFRQNTFSFTGAITYTF
jgi:outer membrane scaffolding protein for murein synthesis (MipA/OmpV family)